MTFSGDCAPSASARFRHHPQGVDLSAVNPKPANGDVVAVSGTAAENGAALKVDTLRVMPKAG